MIVCSDNDTRKILYIAATNWINENLIVLNVITLLPSDLYFLQLLFTPGLWDDIHTRLYRKENFLSWEDETYCTYLKKYILYNTKNISVQLIWWFIVRGDMKNILYIVEYMI